MSTRTVSAQVLSRLRDWDVPQVFGLPGDGITGLLAARGRAENRPQFVRIAVERQAPTCLIFPSDGLELEYAPPGHAFEQLSSSLRTARPVVQPDDAADGDRGHDFGAHGEFDQESRTWDRQLGASRNHGAPAAMGAGVLAAVAGRRSVRR